MSTVTSLSGGEAAQAIREINLASAHAAIDNAIIQVSALAKLEIHVRDAFDKAGAAIRWALRNVNKIDPGTSPEDQDQYYGVHGRFNALNSIYTNHASRLPR